MLCCSFGTHVYYATHYRLTVLHHRSESSSSRKTKPLYGRIARHCCLQLPHDIPKLRKSTAQRYSDHMPCVTCNTPQCFLLGALCIYPPRGHRRASSLDRSAASGTGNRFGLPKQEIRHELCPPLGMRCGSRPGAGKRVGDEGGEGCIWVILDG
ncbi:hypothetical protein BDV95DRAFT_373950 [Massariosphaeria phaeospora]|uniref:Uncharacterized protein n=1 Tax=Massariosphaeria phaeospora TaxID=100035 RepID=A0A7C8I882_9PLEO|nr:hypothetical protein BDV95DRAFT_373950 [Massariosphaeria phaeospora]